MSDLFARSEGCRLCGHQNGDDDFACVLSLPPTPLANAFVDAKARDIPQPTYPLDLYRCRRCGHVQLRDLVDPLHVFQRNRTAIANVAPLQHIVRAHAGEILARCPPAYGTLAVVIGSNDGTMLKAFQDTNMRCHGIEPAVDLARTAISDGLDTFPGFFSPAIASRIQDTMGRARIVVAPRALVHAQNPKAFLEGVQALLARDGIFSFEIPYLPDIGTLGLMDRVRHEILDYYALGPLTRLLHACDLELISAQRVDERPGLLRGYAQHLGGPYARDGSVDTLLAGESSLLSDSSGWVDDFRRRVEDRKQAILDVLDAWKSKGLRIAAIGATARSTSLLYALGIGPETLDFVADDCRWKQGLFTPGLHIPILSPDALGDKNIDAVMVLSWDFADAIIECRAAFSAADCRFIVPLPEMRIMGNP
ncbi:MAG: methyltransferase domain-containing protein [Rhodospirillales bacterium]|nr:methyltransferase domain-containing protein [Rhodospirillales bacterium]